MRHLKAGRKLGRNASHRLALKRNLTRSLIQHERIITTTEKAKELRPFVEKIITIVKKGLASANPAGMLHARRQVLSRLGPLAKAPFYDDEGNPTDDFILKKLFDDIGPRFASRPGGYTRVIKRHERRLGDAGRTAFIELLKVGESKIKTRSPAPAPRVATPPPPVETPPSPPPAPAPEASAAPESPASAPTAAPEQQPPA